MFDLFWFFRRNKPTPRQRAFLRDLGVREKPRTKDEASMMIDETIGHWEGYFTEQFPDWRFAPREITRPLTIYARHSRFDSDVAYGESLAPADLRELLEESIGLECAELLKRGIDVADLCYGLHYIKAYAEAAGVRSPSPLYHYAIFGVLCRAKLLRHLCHAGQFLQWENDDGIEVLQETNKLNTALQEVLSDRDLRKRIKKLAR